MHIELFDDMFVREFKGKLYSIYELLHILALVLLNVKKMTFYGKAIYCWFIFKHGACTAVQDQHGNKK
jgi:hypothetical protein